MDFINKIREISNSKISLINGVIENTKNQIEASAKLGRKCVIISIDNLFGNYIEIEKHLLKEGFKVERSMFGDVKISW